MADKSYSMAAIAIEGAKKADELRYAALEVYKNSAAKKTDTGLPSTEFVTVDKKVMNRLKKALKDLHML